MATSAVLLGSAACVPVAPPGEPAATPQAATDPDRYRQVRHPPERASLRVLVLAPEVIAPGETQCFAVVLVNDGASGHLMFSGGAGSVGIDLVLRTLDGTVVRFLSRGHPPLAAGVDRQMGSREGIVVARRWDLTGVPADPAPGFDGDHPPDGEYLLEGVLLTREQGRLSATTRLAVRTGAATRTSMPDLCP